MKQEGLQATSVTRPAATVQEQVQSADKTTSGARRKRGNRSKVITVSYLNEMPPGALEQALANIYATKIKNGHFDI